LEGKYPTAERDKMSITIQPNPKGTFGAVLASFVALLTVAVKGTDRERFEADGMAYPWSGKFYTGFKCPYGTVKVRRQNGDLWRVSILWPAGRGGIATGTKDVERVFVFHSPDDLTVFLDALRSDPRNPPSLEVTPHGVAA
jgi:hypothetical protein